MSPFGCVPSVVGDPYVAIPFLRAFTPAILAYGMINIEIVGDLNLNLNLKDEHSSTRVCLWARYPDGNHFIAAGFSLRPMAGCCGVLISHQSFVAHAWQGKGIGHLMQDMKDWIGKTLKIGKLIATVVEGNGAEEHILRKHGWAAGIPFINHRTGHTVVEWEKVFK